MTTGTAFSFICTQCREKAAVVKQGRKVFLCAKCASDAMWREMVAGIIDRPDVDQDDGARQS
ncbi:MAG: hypothetical protein GWP04_03480 [Gammaproteobacteria bacterium]|nr:hypothetical protein [Gammaproteobacteria bacterium]